VFGTLVFGTLVFGTLVFGTLVFGTLVFGYDDLLGRCTLMFDGLVATTLEK